jgi:dihydrofolate reductase/thymidylate synthase
MEYALIAACTLKGGIGRDNQVPWNLPTDRLRFAELTKGHIVIMGKNTYQSLPPRYRPLPHRRNIVITRSSIDNVITVSSFDDALKKAQDLQTSDKKVFVIGGRRLYACALQDPRCTTLFITHIYSHFDCNVFMPFIDRNVFDFVSQSAVTQENGVDFQFIEYKRRHEEYQYLDLVASCIESGNWKPNRTGIDTCSHFGKMMRFNLRDGTFPLLTTKTVFWRGVVEELLWFIHGSTDSELLRAKKVNIWCCNASRKALDERGFTDRREGDLGPVYGFQWRHFGADYVDCATNYEGKGIDQLANVVDMLRTNPNDRRIILCAWNPSQLKQMALPPCHVLCQFYVYDNELSCLMYQRSADCGLGVPFNIASYCLLTCIIAHVCGLKPGEFIHSLGDTHVYQNHVEALQEQLKREPRPFPTLHINPERMKIEDFCFEDFILHGYDPHPAIKMEMAV